MLYPYLENDERSLFTRVHLCPNFAGTNLKKLNDGNGKEIEVTGTLLLRSIG
jgi:hypothetical protein